MRKTEYKMMIDCMKACTSRDEVFRQITSIVPKLCSETEITDEESFGLLYEVTEIQRKLGTTPEEQERIDMAVGDFFLNLLGGGRG